MKLKNKKTGEIGFLRVELGLFNGVEKFLVELATDEKMRFQYGSLAELHKIWEDYEEQKGYWFINDLDGEPMKCDWRNCGKKNFARWGEHRKQIGNYFETEEEAEKAVEKLKAWKRLKDKGVEFKGWGWEAGLGNYVVLGTKDNDCLPDEIELNRRKDLDLLFGGKE